MQQQELHSVSNQVDLKYHLGLDIGSISVNAVLIDDDKNINELQGYKVYEKKYLHKVKNEEIIVSIGNNRIRKQI